MAIRFIKAIIVSTIALFFTLVAFNNVTDFETNQKWTAQIVSLSSVSNHNVYWRALPVPGVQIGIFYFIIFWEITTALFLWGGTYRMIRYIHVSPSEYARVKIMALVGLTLGFVMYMVGFVDMASEWFYAWQSELKSAQIKSILFSLLTLLALAFVASNTQEHVEK